MTPIKLDDMIDDKFYLIYYPDVVNSASGLFKGYIICRVENSSIKWVNDNRNIELLAPLSVLEYTWLYFELSEDEVLNHYIMAII